MSSPDVTLYVGGQAYAGWSEIEIEQGLEQIAGRFDLAVTERWPGQWQDRRIQRGQECRVEIDGETAIVGYVDGWFPSYDANGHTVRVTGRDKAGDLVDCAARHASGHWRGVDLLQIASDLARPFGIQVVAGTGTGAPFPDFALQEGESIWEAITRAAGMRGFLFVSEEGKVVLQRAGQLRHATVLERGKNIESGEGEFTLHDRYSEYIVKGQRRGTDDDADTPELLSGSSGVAEDRGVLRYRPLILIAEEPGTVADFRRRAEWERNLRFGRSNRVRYIVSGWRENNLTGALWRPNFKVSVADNWMGLNGEMLIASVRFIRGDGGTYTEIEVTDPAAFALLNQPQNFEAARRRASYERPAEPAPEDDAPALPPEEEEEEEE